MVYIPSAVLSLQIPATRLWKDDHFIICLLFLTVLLIPVKKEKSQSRDCSNVSSSVLDKLGKNKPQSTQVINDVTLNHRIRH